jgi:hypothetical protein
MRYSPFSLFAALFIATVSSAPVRRDVDPSLIPPFGHDAGINPTGDRCLDRDLDETLTLLSGTGNCDGAVIGSNGQPIEVPCTCPPPRDQFISVSIMGA